MFDLEDLPRAGTHREVVACPMIYFAFSCDHSIVAGKGAMTFPVRVKEALEDSRRNMTNL